jgi:hypothetical protein
LTEPDTEFSEMKRDTNGIQTGYPIPFVKPLSDIGSSFKRDKRDTFAFASDNAESQRLSCTTEPAEFAEQIRKAITDLDAAFVEGTTTIKKVAAQYSLEIIQEAIAQIEAKDPDAAEELRDALGLDTATLADEMRSALASADRKVARKVWNQVKNDKTAQQNLKQQLTEDENINVRLLLNCGFIQGMRVKYVGDPKFAEQFEGLELVVDDIDSSHGVCCKKPDGSWTAYLNKADWQKI